jgi:hypothetical protein
MPSQERQIGLSESPVDVLQIPNINGRLLYELAVGADPSAITEAYGMIVDLVKERKRHTIELVVGLPDKIFQETTSVFITQDGKEIGVVARFPLRVRQNQVVALDAEDFPIVIEKIIRRAAEKLEMNSYIVQFEREKSIVPKSEMSSPGSEKPIKKPLILTPGKKGPRKKSDEEPSFRRPPNAKKNSESYTYNGRPLVHMKAKEREYAFQKAGLTSEEIQLISLRLGLLTDGIPTFAEIAKKSGIPSGNINHKLLTIERKLEGKRTKNTSRT